MTRKIRTRWVVALVLLLAWLEAPVYAYIDPSTGSMMVQGVIAAVTSAAVVSSPVVGANPRDVQRQA
jgi:hypothetical protein